MAGIFFLTLSDANAKWLGASYHPLQILFLRALIALPVVTALALWLGGRRVLRTGHLRLHLARGAINVVSACCFYLGLNSLPLAEATAIAFAAPLFVTALSVFVLKERVDSRRWLAVLAGFAGVLIIVRPGTDAFQAATLLPLTTAMLYAVMMTTARGISPSEGMLTTTFYIVAGQFLCSILTLPWVWQAPAIGDLPYFAGVALFSTLGLTLITQAFRIAPASVVAPFDYTGLIWATVLGWVFWREAPDALAYLGAAFIAGSGIYIALREARSKPRRVSAEGALFGGRREVATQRASRGRIASRLARHRRQGRADRFKPGRPRTPARHHGHVQVQRRKPLAQHVRRAGLPLQLLPQFGAARVHALAQQVGGRAFRGPLRRIVAIGEGRIDGRDQPDQQVQEARALGLVGQRRQAGLRRHVVQMQDHGRAFCHDLTVRRHQRRHLA